MFADDEQYVRVMFGLVASCAVCKLYISATCLKWVCFLENESLSKSHPLDFGRI